MNVFLKKYTLEIVLGVYAATMAAVGGYAIYSVKKGTDKYVASVDRYTALLERVSTIADFAEVEITVEEDTDDVNDED